VGRGPRGAPRSGARRHQGGGRQDERQVEADAVGRAERRRAKGLQRRQRGQQARRRQRRRRRGAGRDGGAAQHRRRRGHDAPRLGCVTAPAAPAGPPAPSVRAAERVLLLPQRLPRRPCRAWRSTAGRSCLPSRCRCLRPPTRACSRPTPVSPAATPSLSQHLFSPPCLHLSLSPSPSLSPSLSLSLSLRAKERTPGIKGAEVVSLQRHEEPTTTDHRDEVRAVFSRAANRKDADRLSIPRSYRNVCIESLFTSLSEFHPWFASSAACLGS
jgi:hypothetical protein